MGGQLPRPMRKQNISRLPKTVIRQIKSITKELYGNKWRDQVPPRKTLGGYPEVSQLVCSLIPFPIDVGDAETPRPGQVNAVMPSSANLSWHQPRRRKGRYHEARIAF